MCLLKHRYTSATYAFIKRLIRHYGEPRALVTDKYVQIRLQPSIN
ncbi:hypothetical protein CMALT394_610007 [Carnobacterium maltaromaticum]|nr:hypothetical protein CMALT394_610007 [Carnobacterium maltaromaticum]